ncbi:AraC family transcriptional regulator [Amycolatopsis sp. A1MSW2902]|uniref:AraC family transcriptional regulator n=1 Tax=Amycolatopsis sp. A1MSW2902 TaxID=687413 RepID=UPI00307F79F4
MSTTQTVPISFVHRLLRVAERRGFDVLPMLRAAGIPADIAYRPRTRVTVEQMARVTRDLWRLTGDELFGLGPPIPLGTLKFVTLAVIHAEDLRAVGIRVAGATKVLAGVPRLKVAYGDSTARVELDVSKLDDPEHLGTELMLALVHRLLGWLAGKRIPLRALEFPYPSPPHAADYDKIFGCPAVFDAPVAAFEFDSALLDSPVVRSERDLEAFLGDQPGIWYATRDYGSTVADQVRKILEHGLRGQWPTAEQIAARCNVSVQHLRRLLREQDTSISEIKEEILRDAAIASLVRGEEPVDELAARLGFSEASAFRRAFRRWTGSPPGAYRGE